MMLFTDFYQLTMAYGYWVSQRARSPAVFEIFFRKCPFQGEFAIVAGHDRVREILENFRFTDDEINFLKEHPSFQKADPGFFEYLKQVDLSDIEASGLPEGSVAFPRIPILQLKGPVLPLQILESALLNAVNFGTLVATAARRIRLVAEKKLLVEFGMRRAQGPNGAMTASRSSYMGGFDGTSNLEASRVFGIPAIGTMAHAFVQSFSSLSKSHEHLRGLKAATAHEGELAAFLTYADAFPNSCTLLLDTYNTLQSGLPNAVLTFRYMKEKGFKPRGVRLDSGDLVYLSQQCRKALDEAGFPEATIFASNELDEIIIESLNRQGACIDGYGVGTHLTTASAQPALGGVYKLVSIDDRPCMKISEQTIKMIIPGEKTAYRLYDKNGMPLVDLLCLSDESRPQPLTEIQVHHPFDPFKQMSLTPDRVELLHHPLWKGGAWVGAFDLDTARSVAEKEVNSLRNDIVRRENPTPYKVSLSPRLRQYFHSLYESTRLAPSKPI